MIYGYCRVSTTHQRITRQITNIKEVYPSATFIKEFYTGTTQNRPLWDKLMKQIEKGDTIVFDSVSRMSRMVILEDTATPLREVEGYENGINYREIASSLPYMFADNIERVEFLADERIIDQVIDWFGNDADIEQLENGKLKVTVRVSQRAMEYWSMQYLNCVEIILPQSLREKIKENLRQATEKYQ